jgi:hypothetical protein
MPTLLSVVSWFEPAIEPKVALANDRARPEKTTARRPEWAQDLWIYRERPPRAAADSGFVLKRSAAELSPQQHRFAREHGATPGMRGGEHDRSVYVYREEGWRTCRWLVDPAGRVVDFTSLRYPSAPSESRFVRGGAGGAQGERSREPALPRQVLPGDGASR